jgi:predicted MFS family arabinose efflux permease
MSGVMIGVMLARSASSFVAGIASWHAVFYISAACITVLALSLSLGLPERVPVATVTYRMLLKSMGHLALRTRVLQRRAFYQAGLFGAFSDEAAVLEQIAERDDQEQTDPETHLRRGHD